MDSAQLVGILCLILVFGTLYFWIRDWKRGRLKYSMKKSANSVRPMVHMMVGVYGLVIGIWTIPWVVEKASGMTASTRLAEILIIQGMPFVYSIMLFLIFLWVVLKGVKPFFKYTEQEQKWEEESKARLGKTMRKWKLSWLVRR